MAQRPYNVLYLCTPNSARSILAEAITNNLSITGGKLKGFSAGTHPQGDLNPFALMLLRENDLPIEDLRSKSCDEFAESDAPPLDFVFTVCDQAAGEA